MSGVSFTVVRFNRFSRYLLGVALLSIASTACSNGLRDYVQLNVQVSPPSEANSSELTEDILQQTIGILENRLAGQGIETVEIETADIELPETEADPPQQITIRLPLETNLTDATQNLLNRGLLRLRLQKADTEEELANNIANLQRLLVEQNTLRQTNKQSEAAALQPEIDSTRAAISELFEPSELTGKMLLDAQAVQITGFNTWEIKIWFNTQGAALFTEQTKAIAGTGRAIGIFLDNVLLSTPIVGVEYAEAGIPGGEAVISGSFTREAAKDLEVQLKSGALPVELDLVSVSSSEEPEATEAKPEETEDTADTEDINGSEENKGTENTQQEAAKEEKPQEEKPQEEKPQEEGKE